MHPDQRVRQARVDSPAEVEAVLEVGEVRLAVSEAVEVVEVRLADLVVVDSGVEEEGDSHLGAVETAHSVDDSDSVDYLMLI